MNEQKITQRIPHNIIMNDCEKISLSGVTELVSFDDRTIVCITSKGELVIRGEDLHVDKVELSVGDMDINGNILSLVYTGQSGKKGLVHKLFK